MESGGQNELLTRYNWEVVLLCHSTQSIGYYTNWLSAYFRLRTSLNFCNYYHAISCGFLKYLTILNIFCLLLTCSGTKLQSVEECICLQTASYLRHPSHHSLLMQPQTVSGTWEIHSIDTRLKAREDFILVTSSSPSSTRKIRVCSNYTFLFYKICL